MDEPLSLESTSLFSSIADAPLRMEKQYAPLAQVFYEHSTELPDQSLPEPNSEAMVQALRALQEKISSLESDRATAKEEIMRLSKETEGYTPTFVKQDTHCRDPLFSKLQKTLSRMDARFYEQASELNDMKERLDEAETKHRQGIACSKKLEQQRKQLLQHHRKILHHISRRATVVPAKSPACKQRKTDVTVCHCKPVPGVHYRVNFKDLPFLLTASTSPSHSVTANYQQVLASMKCHSPLLCGAAAAKKAQKVPKSKRKTELKSLLTALEEEFGQLTFKHQELAQQLTEVPSTLKDCSQWEKQLKFLVEQMESKAEQIGIVSREIQCGDRHRATQNYRKSQESSSARDASLKLLRNMKSIHTMLQQDDLSWD